MTDEFALLRTDSSNPHFQQLVHLLDANLAERDGPDHAYYAQFNTIQAIRYALVGYWGETPVACGAIKAFDETCMEVKRMYVLPEYRGRGLASRVLAELEKWASELGASRTVLETGKKQVEAMKLYPGNGYTVIPNYGQYIGIDNSVCFAKDLNN